MARKLMMVLLALTLANAAGLTLAACADQPPIVPTEEPPPVTTTPPMEDGQEAPEGDAAQEGDAAREGDDIVDTAMAAGNFNALVDLIQQAGLEEVLRGEGPFTVFAPSDEAFDQVPLDTMDSLAADPEGALQEVLAYHVIRGRVMAAEIEDGMEVETLQGGMMTLRIQDDTVMVNGANVVDTDVEASNGVIHVIESVLLPPGR